VRKVFVQPRVDALAAGIGGEDAGVDFGIDRSRGGAGRHAAAARRFKAVFDVAGAERIIAVADRVMAFVEERFAVVAEEILDLVLLADGQAGQVHAAGPAPVLSVEDGVQSLVFGGQGDLVAVDVFRIVEAAAVEGQAGRSGRRIAQGEVHAVDGDRGGPGGAAAEVIREHAGAGGADFGVNEAGGGGPGDGRALSEGAEAAAESQGEEGAWIHGCER
jgi:hypothetical protein